jgi:hypothetical protein
MDNDEKRDYVPYRDADVSPDMAAGSSHEFGQSRSMQKRLAIQRAHPSPSTVSTEPVFPEAAGRQAAQPAIKHELSCPLVTSHEYNEWHIVKRYCTPFVMLVVLESKVSEAYTRNAEIMPLDQPVQVRAFKYRKSIIPETLELVFKDVLKNLGQDIYEYKRQIIDFRMLQKLCNAEIKATYPELFAAEPNSSPETTSGGDIPTITI